MSKTIVRSVAAPLALALILTAVLTPAPARASHQNSVPFAAACATPASVDCVVSVRVGTLNGAGGTALPAGVALSVFLDTARGHVQAEMRRGTDYDVAPAISESTEVTLVIRFASTFTPVAIVAVSSIRTWTWDAATRQLTVVAFPRASSWVFSGGCSANVADVDYAAMVLMVVDDAVPPPNARAKADFLGKFAGGYISTNAQCFALPYYDAATAAVKFDLGSPHFKRNGTTLSTGFFRVLVPDPVIRDLWRLDPAAFALKDVSVTVAGAAAAVALTRASGRAGLPDGWIFENTAPFGYSEPTVAIAPAGGRPAPAAAPAAEPAAPRPDDGGAPTLPESGIGAVDREGPVRVPLSGAVRVPTTVRGAGASLGFAPDTALTTAGGAPFSGIIQAPFRSGDPTGGKLVSPTTLLATGGPAPLSDVRLSRPARLTLPLPAGERALDHQAVLVDGGRLTFLDGALTESGIAVEVERLGDRHTVYGLMKVARPAATPVARDIPSQPGLHARWAGQSPAVELAPGQMADVTVLLRNAGDAPWIRGRPGRQVTLGTTTDSAFRAGLVAAPLWGTDRLATTEEAVVPAGEVGSFVARLRAPATPGTYRVSLRPVVDGVAWLEDEGIYVEVVVR